MSYVSAPPLESHEDKLADNLYSLARRSGDLVDNPLAKRKVDTKARPTEARAKEKANATAKAKVAKEKAMTKENLVKAGTNART